MTNNPRGFVNPELTAASTGVIFVHRVEGSPLDVIACAEELLQEGRCLITAPLPPNIPLMRAPYRSLLLARTGQKYDVQGLRALAKARERLTVQRAIDEDAGPGRSEDFAFIDEDLLLRGLRDYLLSTAVESPISH